MKYQLLKKLYYQDKDLYQNEYLKRFNAETTIKTGFFIKENEAFVVMSPEVLKLTNEVLRLDKELVKIEGKLPGIALTQFRNRCLIDEIVLTNNIEGVHSSRKEINEVLAELEEQSSKKKSSRFKGMVNKYKKLLEKEELTFDQARDIRTIYDELVLEEVESEDKDSAPDGELFRKNGTTIYGADGKPLHYGLTPESAIISAVDKSLAFLNDDSIDVLYRICLFHYFLEYIHPFYDGNGRLGRFILSYHLFKEFMYLVSVSISSEIKTHINEYYKAFDLCNDSLNKGDITPFLIMMLTMIKQSEENVLENLTEKRMELNHYKEKIPALIPKNYKDKENLGNLYYLLVQGSLLGENGFSIDALINISKSSKYIMNKLLDEIEKNDLLVISKMGNRKYYSINLEKMDLL